MQEKKNTNASVNNLDINDFLDFFMFLNTVFDAKTNNPTPVSHEKEGVITAGENKYRIKVLPKRPDCDLDLESNTSLIFNMAEDILSLLEEKDYITFSFGSTDAHKCFISVSRLKSESKVRELVEGVRGDQRETLKRSHA